MHKETDWKKLSRQLKTMTGEGKESADLQALSAILNRQQAVNIALAMEELAVENACCVFTALNRKLAIEVLGKLHPKLAHHILTALKSDNLAGFVQSLPPREAAAVVTEAPGKLIHSYLNDESADPSAVNDVKHRLNYRKRTAGRLMTTQFVHLYSGTTIGDAISVIKHTDPAIDIPNDLYIVKRDTSSDILKNQLLGVISIRDLLMNDTSRVVDEVMETDVISVEASADEKDAAALLSKYKFMTLPVVDQSGYLAGVIPIDDLINITNMQAHRLYTKAVGTDTQTMERLSPLQAAKLRVPWLLGTMVIEIIAGMVISHFDAILSKVILLASFMPVISAISGNVGLQSAAITVRALDTRQMTKKNILAAIAKELFTSLLMAAVCGLTLGTIGAIWSKHLPFGIVIGCALTCSMVTAGLMGTSIPVVSKRLGFDPATTAGPFETAFQDIIGFAVFLGMATQLQHWIS